MLRYGLIYIATFMFVCGEYNAIEDQAMRPFDDKFSAEISDNKREPRESIDSLNQKNPRCTPKNRNIGSKPDNLDIGEKELAKIGKLFMHHLAKDGRKRVETYDIPKEEYDEEHHEQYVDKDFVEEMQKIDNITNEGQMLYDELGGPPTIKYDPNPDNLPNICCNEESLIDNSNTNHHDLKMHFYKFSPDKIDDKRAISLYPDRNQYYKIPQKFCYIAFLSNDDKFVDVPAVKLNVFSDDLKRGKRTKNFVPFFTTLYKRSAENKLKFKPLRKRFTHTPVLFFNTISGAKRHRRLAKTSSKPATSNNKYLKDADALLNKVNFFLKLGDEENEIRQISAHVFPKKQVKKEIKVKNGFKEWLEDDYDEEPRSKKESQNDQFETSSIKENFDLLLGFDGEDNELKTTEATTMRPLTTTACKKSAIDMTPIEIENMMKDVVAKIDLPPLVRNDFASARDQNKLLNSEESGSSKEDLVNDFIKDDHFKSEINPENNNLDETIVAEPHIFSNSLLYDNNENKIQSDIENTTDSQTTEKSGNLSCAYLLDLFKNIEALKKTDPNLQKICPKLSELSHMGENSITTGECLNKTSETAVSVSEVTTQQTTSTLVCVTTKEESSSSSVSSSLTTQEITSPTSSTTTTTESTTIETSSVTLFSTTEEISSSCITTESTTQEEASISLSPYNMTHETPPETSPFPTKIEETTSPIVQHSQSVPPQQSNELLTSFRFTNKISRDLEGVSKEHFSPTISTQKTTETPCLPTKIDETITSEENTSPPTEENDLSESFQLLNKTFQQLESAFENLTSGNANTSSQIEGGTASEVPGTTTELRTTFAISEVSKTTSEIVSFTVSEIIVPIIEVTESSSVSSTSAETAELTQQASSSPVVEVNSTTASTPEETTLPMVSLKSEGTTNFASAISETTLESSMETEMTSSATSPSKLILRMSSTIKEEYPEENLAQFTKPIPTSVLKMEEATISGYFSSTATPETSASTSTETETILTTNSATYSPELEETSSLTTSFNIPTEKQLPESKESPTVTSTTKEEYAEENLVHFTKSVPTSVLKMEGITTNEYTSMVNEVPIISATPIEDVKLTSLAKILFPPYIHIPTYKTNEVEDNAPKETNPSVTFSTNDLQNGPTIYAPYAHIPTYRTNQFQEVSSSAFPPKFTPLPPTKSLTTSSQNLEDMSNEYTNYRDEELSAILDLLGHDLGTSTTRTNNNTCEGILGKIKRKVFSKLHTAQKDLKLVLAVKNLLLKSKNRQKENGIRRKKDVHLHNGARPKSKRAPASKEKRMKQVKRLGKILQWRNMEFVKKKSAKNRKKRRK